MTEPTTPPAGPVTEAGRRLLATLRSFLDMEEGHPTWLHVGGPQAILAIEAEAREAIRREVSAAVDGMFGWVRRGPNSISKADVLALLAPDTPAGAAPEPSRHRQFGHPDPVVDCPLCINEYRAGAAPESREEAPE